MQFSIVVAATEKGGIGLDNALPWNIPGDMRFFKELTSKTEIDGQSNVVIMGRKTWESIPKKFRPLRNRLNVILTRNPDKLEEDKTTTGVLVAKSLGEALSKPRLLQFAASKKRSVGRVFVIGGASVYDQALKMDGCRNIFLTRIHKDFNCDTFFKFDETAYSVKSKSASVVCPKSGHSYQFLTYARCSAEKSFGEGPECKVECSSPSKRAKVEHEEHQYLRMIEDIIANGIVRKDRTGTGTVSKFGATMRFSLRDNVIPVLTTKRVFWRGVAEELFWFISGCTDNKVLQEKRIRIWDGNGSREFLDKRGLGHRREGDLGPVYGFQWRHFGAKYSTCDADYTGKGVDQLAQVIQTIKTNPTSRRIVMSAWNPFDLPQMALPPCHMFAQFYVDPARKELSCQMYQRSADMGLGVPFNIASYALLTHLIAHCCGLRAAEFVHVIGDAHVYLNHVEPLKEQLKREPLPFPKLRIKTASRNIDEIRYEDIELVGYKSHKTIKMKMAV